MFQFSGLALSRVIYLQYTGLSHSEIFGLSVVCTYPKLIAAYHVLHRLLVPRHPPYALIRFKYCILHPYHSGEWQVLLNYYLTTCLVIHTHSMRLYNRQKLLSQYVKELFSICQSGN